MVWTAPFIGATNYINNPFKCLMTESRAPGHVIYFPNAALANGNTVGIYSVLCTNHSPIIYPRETRPTARYVLTMITTCFSVSKKHRPLVVSLTPQWHHGIETWIAQQSSVWDLFQVYSLHPPATHPPRTGDSALTPYRPLVQQSWHLFLIINCFCHGGYPLFMTEQGKIWGIMWKVGKRVAMT